jgi:LysM repeat protein
MTRETKISLLVGLAFIIVIGILLSDHFRSTQELPQAVLADVGNSSRRATDAPGAANPGISFVPPSESAPRTSVPTQDELTAPPSPVVPSSHYENQPPVAPPSANSAPPSEVQHSPIAEEARRNGESVEPSNLNGTPRDDDSSATPPPPAPPAAGSTAPSRYKAAEGDTVSRMAAKFLGGNTRANRQAIIDANPSLQEDPNRVIVGHSYVIPARGESALATNDDSDAPPISKPQIDSQNDSSPNSAGSVYTVKEGDSLWAIANDELGDPSAVEAIKDLNSTVLKGDNHDVVIPGMKLRLPGKPVADTNN